MRTIRILENRLDKVMIKYNEAQSIRKTYEQIVKRLKEERVGYDNQLAAIERSLKGKEHDFEELLLLKHDANHAKELAQAELRKYEQKVMIILVIELKSSRKLQLETSEKPILMIKRRQFQIRMISFRDWSVMRWIVGIRMTQSLMLICHKIIT
jgi:hypothetical protein